MGKGRDKKKKAAKRRGEESKRSSQPASQQGTKKRSRKQDDQYEVEEDIDALLESFEAQLKADFAVKVELETPPPSRRANASLVATASIGWDDEELILFGGEAFDGKKVSMFNDLYRYSLGNTGSSCWKRICSPNAPGPRSSHQTVLIPPDKLYLFGGEFVSPNETSFFHYKDFWVFDLKANEWEKLDIRGDRPAPRSGHRMVAYKHWIILFGGFYDAARETKYYDDLWIFDTLSLAWAQIELPEPKPSPRSGFQFFFDGDKTVYLYGGYTKIYTKGQKTRGLVHQDVWALRISSSSLTNSETHPKKSALERPSFRWEKRKRPGGFVPSLRSGSTMIAYKGRGILFGGVSDLEESEESIESVCHSDAYQYSLETNKWFPLSVRPPKSILAKKQSVTEAGLDTQKPRAPGPRFNCMMTVSKKSLYIYGGILEQGSKETTLCDLWSLNLDKPYEWNCLLEDDVSTAEWLGEDSNDEEDVDEEEEEDESDDSNSDTDDKEDEQNNDTNTMDQIQSVTLSEHSHQDSDDDDEFVSSIPVPDPLPTESLREYFLRTSPDWQLRAIELFEEQESEEALGIHSGGKGIKGLRRDAFSMAQLRYNKLLPELEAMRARLKAEEAQLEMATRKAKGKDQDLLTSRHRDR